MQKLLSVFENIIYWLLIILMIFIPLFMKFPLAGVSGSFVSIRLEDIFIAISLFVLGVYLVVSKNIQNFLKDKLNVAILLFFVIGIISTISAAFVTQTVGIKLGLFHLLRRVELIMLLPLAVNAVKTKRNAFVLVGVFALTTLLASLYGLGQRYLHFPAVSTTTAELSKGTVYFLTLGDRVVSTFAGHYDFAIFLVMFLSIASALFIYFLSKRNFLAVGVTLGLSGLSMLLLVLTAARLSFVAAIVGVVSSLFILGKKKYILIFMIVIAVALAYPSQLRDRLVSTVTVNILKSWDKFVSDTDTQQARSQLNISTLPDSRYRPTEENNRTESVDIVPGEPTDPTQLGVLRSFDIRVNVEWPRALRAFYKNPLLGTGYSSIGLATDNDFLRLLGEVGLLGVWAFGLVLIEIFKRVWKVYKEEEGFFKYFAVGILSMMISFLVNALFIDVFEASKIAAMFWILIGICISLSKFNYEKNNN